MKTIIYHQGSVPSKDVQELLKKSLSKIPCRNASYFSPKDMEKADLVIVEDGKNATAIVEAYTAAKAKVLSVKEYLKKGSKPEAETKEPTPFNPDAKPEAPTRGRGQGTKAE